jgi:hypothetical protein
VDLFQDICGLGSHLLEWVTVCDCLLYEEFRPLGNIVKRLELIQCSAANVAELLITYPGVNDAS